MSRPSAWALRVARRSFDGDIEAVAELVDWVRDLAIRAAIDELQGVRVRAVCDNPPREPGANEALLALNRLAARQGLPWPSTNARRRNRVALKERRA